MAFPRRPRRAFPRPLTALSGSSGATALVLLVALLAAGAPRAQDQSAADPNAGDKGVSRVELPPVIPGPEPDVILLFTGMVSGYVEPCGCPKNPAGGVPRRAGYVGMLEKEFPHAKVLLLDAGEFASEFNPPGKIKNNTYLDLLDDMKYDVVALGERELAGGLVDYHDLFDKRKFSVISASYTERGSDKLLAKPYVIREIKLADGGKLRLGIISLHAYNSAFVATGEGYTPVISRDPVEQARRYVPEVAAQSDLVVLLAGMGLKDLGRVGREVPGAIDVALGGWGDRLSPGGFDLVAGIPTFYAGDQGKRFGEVRIYYRDGKLADMKPYLVHLTQRYPADKKYQKIVDKMLVQVNDYMKSLPPSVMEAMAAKLAPAPKSNGPIRFLTATNCGRCHKDALDKWNGSDHSHAMATLRNANQDFNPDCVKCHSTAFEVPGGFISMNASPQLANVQCEACHGSGEQHVQNPDEPYGSVQPRTCYSCHTKENSPDFSFFKYWAIIKH